MPVVKIERLVLAPMQNTPTGLTIHLAYSIPQLGASDILEITT